MAHSMTRRSAILAGIGAAFFPLQALTQEATPAATPEATSGPFPLEVMDGLTGGVNRSFELETIGPSILMGGLINLLMSGYEYDTPDQAAAALAWIAEEYPAYQEAGMRADTSAFTVTSFDVAAADAGDLGDDRTGHDLAVQITGAPFTTLSLAMFAVRKDRWVQIALGFGVVGAVEPTLAVIASIDDRWPSDDLWDMVPTLEDVPEGMVLEEEKTVEPAA